MHNELSRAAEALRDRILHDADGGRATIVANELIEAALAGFNSANTSIATSLFARALVARAMIQVAAKWLTDVTKQPLPETHAAILALVDALPPFMEEDCVLVDGLTEPAQKTVDTPISELRPAHPDHADLAFHFKLGCVAPDGTIWIGAGARLSAGRVQLTETEAEKAKRFGWAEYGTRVGKHVYMEKRT